MHATVRLRRLGFLALLPLAAVAVAADPPWIARGQAGLVATDSPEASQIGADVLQAGGNAFDAAVAVSFALAVARPESTGLGGGGFLVAWSAAEHRYVALDFREMAPASATPQRYARLHADKPGGPSPSIHGGNAVGVPGQVAGLAEINRRFGTRPLSELIRPAAALAKVGFAADAHYRDACREALADFERWPPLKHFHKALYHSLLGDGTPPPVGARIARPDLADGLNLLAREGPECFYRGEIAAAIVKAVAAAGGELTRHDLFEYRVRERTPLRGVVGEFELITMPPPSSGGVCLIECLNILQCLAPGRNLADLVRSDAYEPALVRAFQHAFADRARWLGDPDFAELPTARLLDRAYACALAARSGDGLDDFGSTNLPDDGGTSHFCVADGMGNLVAQTETINGTFGSLVVAEPFGILLNNQLDDFLTVPGQANLFGLQQSELNLIAPGKRPLSSMSPTIVTRDGRPVLMLGGSGGPRIITAVAQVLLNVLLRGQPLEGAVASVRVHHQWQPAEVYFDDAPAAKRRTRLAEAGHTISDRRRGGVVQAIQFAPDGTMIGASDPRRGGRPVAVPAD